MTTKAGQKQTKTSKIKTKTKQKKIQWKRKPDVEVPFWKAYMALRSKFALISDTKFDVPHPWRWIGHACRPGFSLPFSPFFPPYPTVFCKLSILSYLSHQSLRLSLVRITPRVTTAHCSMESGGSTATANRLLPVPLPIPMLGAATTQASATFLCRSD